MFAHDGEPGLLVTRTLTHKFGVLTDGGQRHPRRAEFDADSEPVDVVLAVNPSPAGTTPHRIGQNALALVKPQRVHAQAGPVRHLTDAQPVHRTPLRPPLDLESTLAHSIPA